MKQFHYICCPGWPDFGVPDYPHPIYHCLHQNKCLNSFSRTTIGPAYKPVTEQFDIEYDSTLGINPISGVLAQNTSAMLTCNNSRQLPDSVSSKNNTNNNVSVIHMTILILIGSITVIIAIVLLVAVILLTTIIILIITILLLARWAKVQR